MSPASLAPDQAHRYDLLVRELNVQGIALRSDSDLCWDYILNGERAKISSDGCFIAHRMAEAEYLHKYCKFQLGYDIAQNHARRRQSQGFPPLSRQEWAAFVNKCVLSTTALKRFPDVWPWLQNIPPHKWTMTDPDDWVQPAWSTGTKKN